VRDRFPGDVTTILGELRGEAVIGALVKTGQKPLDDQTRDQIEATELTDQLR
jgi:hypothetical protein